MHNHKLPLSKGIKIECVLQRVYGDIGRTTSNVQKRDEQTPNRHTKNVNFFGRPGGGEILASPNLAR